MRTITAKQFLNIPEWQAKQATKQAKKALKDKRQQRQGKRDQWVGFEG